MSITLYTHIHQVYSMYIYLCVHVVEAEPEYRRGNHGVRHWHAPVVTIS